MVKEMTYFNFRKEKADEFTLECMKYAIKWIEENSKHRYIDSKHYKSDSTKLEDLIKLPSISFITLNFTDDLKISFTKDCGCISITKNYSKTYQEIKSKRFSNLNEKAFNFLNS